jgi:hypothetical protein
MQAMYGLAVSVRRRGRSLGLLAALALIVGAAVPTMASAETLPVKQTYLALGDSLAFGYSSQLYHQGEVKGFEDPELFEHGYVNVLAKKLAAAAKKEESGLRTINDGCPG